MRRWTLNRVACSAALLASAVAWQTRVGAADSDAVAWPPITQQNKQWTRWWWMGSAVDKQNLTLLLEQYQQAGIGGVEICPIYGVTGQESRYIPYLSTKWMDMLAWTASETQRLDMGMDMTTGTGWPMGGPDVSVDDASSNNVGQRYDVAGGSEFKQNLAAAATGRGPRFPDLKLTVQAAIAFSQDGQKIDLTAQVKNGNIDWTAPDGSWRLYTMVRQAPVMAVKRPAPGGEGNVLDPFSVKAMDDYLAKFDKAFASYKGGMPRAQFHDSYEYVGNDTPDVLTAFKALRGYDLRDELPALYGDGPVDRVQCVVRDYRATMADLHMAYLKRWSDWCHKYGMQSREQAHGAPANLLDLYALADIPETETFGDAASAASDQNFPMNKFASSAAHVTGKALASSESFTWLGQHFQVSFADVKPAADYLMLSGINHMFFHGVAYSPQDAVWPGWLFYASVDFNPNGGLWHDMPAYTSYVAHCQSILQYGKPSNDLLLYFPVDDLWQTPGRSPLIPFVIGGQWLRGTSFYADALSLQSRGYGVDYVSDAQLASARYERGAIVVGGNTYHAIVVPSCKYMPPETAENLVNLAAEGAQVVVQNALPHDVPGLDSQEVHRAQLANAFARVNLPPNTAGGPPQGAPVGLGNFWIGSNLNALLEVAGVQREPMLDLGLEYIRRSYEQGCHYFVVNRGDRAVDGWVTLATPASSIAIMDPMHPQRGGMAAVRKDHAGRTEVYLQLQPDESCFLRTYVAPGITGPDWAYWRSGGEPLAINGNWKIHFIDGGPTLPGDITTAKLASWTAIGDTQARRFAGTGTYSMQFQLPVNSAGDWLLDLGAVAESARVRVNGQDAGTVFSQPFTLHIGSLIHPGGNTLEVDVTNLASNRIKDLDQRGVKWRIFRDVNFVSPGGYGPFNASAWDLRDSGLLGPVKLIPLQRLNPADVK